MSDISPSEVRAALRPCRARPEDFRRGFQEKLARRQAGLRAQLRAEPALRSAAGVLPLGVLHGGAGKAASPLAAQAGSNSLAGTLALPAITLAMLALTFAFSLRALARLGTHAPASGQDAEATMRAWWREHARHASIVLVVLLVLGWTQPLEAVALLLLVSMLAFASLLLRLSRAGIADRLSVGAFAANHLGAVTVLALLVGGLRFELSQEPAAGPWIPLALVAGAVTCSLISVWQASWTPARKAAALTLPLVLLGGVALRLHAKLQAVDRERLVGFVERFDAPLEDVIGWMRAGRVAEWLRVCENVTPAAAPALQRLGRLRAQLAPGESLLDAPAPTHALLGAARAGWLSEADWTAILAEPELRALLELRTDAPLLESGITEWLVRAVAHGEADAAIRARIAKRLLAAWPAPHQPRALAAMAFHAQMLSLLGHAPTGAGVRESAHSALQLHWLGSSRPGEKLAGFSAHPLAAPSEPDVLQIAPTLAAVGLMREFGVPAGVDLDAVEAFLRRAATPSLVEALAPAAWRLLGVQTYRFEGELGLRELQRLRAEQSLPGAAPGFLQRLLEARLLVGALCLVALSLYASLRAAALEWRGAPAARAP